MNNFRSETLAPEMWHGLGTLPESEAAHLFVGPWGKEGFKEVMQGGEEVAAGGWLVSSGFLKCSARILINSVDGSSLMKHIGPDSTEIVFGGVSGLSPQEAYGDFIDHARQAGAQVWAVSFLGDLSTHRIVYPSSRKDYASETMELPDIKLPSGLTYGWAVAFNSYTSEAIARVRDESGAFTYLKFQLPRSQNTDRESASSLVRKVDRRRLLTKSLRHLGMLPLSSPEFHKIDETREGIFGSGTLLTEVDKEELHTIERTWIASFTTKAEFAEDQSELLPAMQALEMLMEVYEAVDTTEHPGAQRALRMANLVFTVMMDLRGKSPAVLSLGGQLLLEQLDSLLNATLPGLSNELDKLSDHVKSLRLTCASILNPSIRP
jgi:hypothetical protein